MTKLGALEEIRISNGPFMLNGKFITTARLIVEDFCGMDVTVGTNGFKGGDSGHGCRTVLEFENDGGDMVVEVKGDDNQTEKVTFRLGGDAELRNLIRCLKFAAEMLEEQSKSGQLTIKAE